jgi:hypothetical protein
MPISREEIVAACRPVLEEVDIHTTETRRERGFITAYQLCCHLKNNNLHIFDDLVQDCGGKYCGNGVNICGKGAGTKVSPPQKIAQALGNSPIIETQYLDTRFLTIKNDIEPSGIDCGIFRLR